MSEVGRLKLKMRPGEFVRVGDAVVAYVENEGESIYVTFAAPRSVPIVRSGKLSEAERRRHSRPSRRSA